MLSFGTRKNAHGHAYEIVALDDVNLCEGDGDSEEAFGAGGSTVHDVAVTLSEVKRRVSLAGLGDLCCRARHGGTGWKMVALALLNLFLLLSLSLALVKSRRRADGLSVALESAQRLSARRDELMMDIAKLNEDNDYFHTRKNHYKNLYGKCKTMVNKCHELTMKTNKIDVDSKCLHTNAFESSKEKCKNYEQLPLHVPNCTGRKSVVPKTVFSVARDNSTYSFVRHTVAATHKDYTHVRFDDRGAGDFVRKHCGDDAGDAYTCLAPPAYRADLFRFCILWARGGVYLDDDILPLRPLEELYSPCSPVSMGHDIDQGTGRTTQPAKQMKVLAGAPGTKLFKCAVDAVVTNVKNRWHPRNSLALTGPLLLNICYEEHPEGVAITYIDTRTAIWPFTGLRAGTKVLAYEMPNEKRHFLNYFTTNDGVQSKDPDDYAQMHSQNNLYRAECPLEHVPFKKPSRHNISSTDRNSSVTRLGNRSVSHSTRRRHQDSTMWYGRTHGSTSRGWPTGKTKRVRTVFETRNGQTSIAARYNMDDMYENKRR